MNKIEKVQENKDLESIRNIFIDYFKNVHFLRDNKYIYNMILDINNYHLYLYLLTRTMLDCEDEDNILKNIEPFLNSIKPDSWSLLFKLDKNSSQDTFSFRFPFT